MYLTSRTGGERVYDLPPLSLSPYTKRRFLTRLGIPKLWREDPELAWPYIMHWFVPAAVWWLARPCYGYGLERVPSSGGGVIAANHISAIDPPLLGILCPRAVYYMAKAELLALPVVGELLTWTGAFPVRRGEGDREALRQARQLVREGHLVGVFLEGTRQRLGHPGEPRPGAFMIALHEQVPLIPCGIYSAGWTSKNRRPSCVVWGWAIDLSRLPSSGEGYREAAETVGVEILRLWRLAGEAIASGFPPALPDGARRQGPFRVRRFDQLGVRRAGPRQ